jgi:hypothetical protein
MKLSQSFRTQLKKIMLSATNIEKKAVLCGKQETVLYQNSDKKQI